MAGRLFGAATRTAVVRSASVAMRTQGVRHMSQVPVDIRQIGDYPDLPMVSAQRRNPFLYDDMQDRRNMGETLQENDEALSMWIFDDVVAGDKLTKEGALKQLLLMLGGLALVYQLAKLMPNESPVTPKQFDDQDAYFPPKSETPRGYRP